MKDPVLKTHNFYFSNERGGECISLKTKFIGNGDPITNKEGVYVNQELILSGYSNAAIFQLTGTTFTPNDLRELANQLESERAKLVK